MPKQWYSIKASSDDVAEVSILEPISPWYGCDAKTFLTEFRALKAPTVKLYINSPGGSVMEALAIFNGMRATGKRIEAHILGVAASAASYIAMAGHKVVMPKNTMMFLHNPISGAYGNADELRDVADVLDKFAVSLTATYAARWKGGEQALKDVLAAETWLTAAECLEHGLCDEVVDEITATASFDIEMLPPEQRALFEAARTTPDPAARSPLSIDDIAAIAKDVGVEAHAGALALDPKLTTADLVRAAAAEAKDIVALCRITAQADDRAGKFIAQRKPLADVRLALQNEQVEADAASRVKTGGKAGDQQNSTAWSPISTWAHINGEKQ